MHDDVSRHTPSSVAATLELDTGPPPLVRLSGISKSFGPVQANQDISLSIHSGRIKALLGENGAGKSTLMSILSGRMLPDRGEIRTRGNPVRFLSPKDALHVGIGMVYQHFTLVDSLSVAENVILGQVKGFFLNRPAMRAKVGELAERYGLPLDPRAKVGDLSMGERQRVEILKLLYRDSTVLILDEPTAVLTPQESEQLFTAMRSMAAQGKALVFISHKLQEVLDISDEIAILRRGRIVDEFDREHVPDRMELARRMLGRELTEFAPAAPQKTGGIVLETEGLSGDGLQDVTLSLRRGEILAVAGVAGNGQKELVETLCGLRKPEQGIVRILAQSWQQFYPAAPRRGGLAYVPEDRLNLAVCPTFSLRDNFLLTNRHEFSRGPWLERGRALREVRELIDAYGVVPARPDVPARALSGGNLQKFVVGRELYRNPKVIIAENPTQGLDVAAMEEVWQRLLDARGQSGILLVTGDLAEAMALANRIAVMYRGRIMDCFDRNDEAKTARIGLLMAGIA